MKGVWKKALVLLLVAVLLVTIYPGFYKESGAQTNLSMDEFEDIIGTYNIDDSILSYKDYVKQYSAAKYPAAVVEIGAKDYVRYEEGGEATTPEVYKDYEGMAGSGLETTDIFRATFGAYFCNRLTVTTIMANQFTISMF